MISLAILLNLFNFSNRNREIGSWAADISNIYSVSAVSLAKSKFSLIFANVMRIFTCVNRNYSLLLSTHQLRNTFAMHRKWRLNNTPPFSTT